MESIGALDVFHAAPQVEWLLTSPAAILATAVLATDTCFTVNMHGSQPLNSVR
eukprot:CAMPEP_0174757742 /NCGR_PEP_ID=MMETSP1094-20130205/107412_1 /TAXON_ID=156173 /ORGANISM="Chrysochromulina brevifilum, Strain UTEX LB 985" /LENGTH=52 /DNA_ID=CAMNT_0015963657 /DNA_START=1066 /DNA_END=1224 /DNA_ORIENTATION=-